MLTNEQQMLANITASKLRAQKFASVKQAKEMKAELVKAMDAIIIDLHQKAERKRVKAAREKAEKDAYRAPFRDAWARANLKGGETVRIGSATEYVVFTVNENNILLMKGQMVHTALHNQITKVKIDDKWVDVYELAAKS